MWQALAEGVVAFLIAFLIGTLVEYLVHRLMHGRKLLAKKHAEHHRDGWGQGWLGEFVDYFLPTLLVIWVGFFYSVAAGVGWALGGFMYAALAAYAHQLQHEYPDLVFWSPWEQRSRWHDRTSRNVRIKGKFAKIRRENSLRKPTRPSSSCSFLAHEML